jgi:MarR family transcriptional regulator, 2-MHQ and catechol-resistance regulon repressor
MRCRGTYFEFKWFKYERSRTRLSGKKKLKTTSQYGKEADLALSMWVKLARASATFGRLTARDIERYGLTQPQFGVLEMLGHLGPLTSGDVGRRLLVTGGSVTVVLDNLEKEGIVERVRSREDRRVITVRLTPKGETRFKEIFPSHARRVTTLASVLTEEEQHQLSTLLKKLGHALRENQ